MTPTGIAFGTKELGLSNRVFVGDCNNGNIYRFKLNSERTVFVFETSELSDNVVNIGESMDEILFGMNFGCITDIEQGPDGFLYVVSLSNGAIYRIVPATSSESIVEPKSTSNEFPIQYIVSGIIGIAISVGIIVAIKKRQKLVK